MPIVAFDLLFKLHYVTNVHFASSTLDNIQLRNENEKSDEYEDSD